ncbi:hypothetical protein VRU48_08110 [Pedobacter sp. KR3-3]|uniref:Uncharacterized protein n=1 Tax=Pedobacter albus TaxID=3113905 RepID=A0ABU7I6T1_9SPHI|nr:hypothetical protein [Pedobacter sp. KR3-3]MEE1945067.1 hypothetical protein [Pedobacter sp. KR3-3]
MEAIHNEPQLLITPTSQLRACLIEQTIRDKGTFYLNDAIVEELAYDAVAQSFRFSGIYPNLFANADEAKIFKNRLEDLVKNSNSRLKHLKIEHIDDILFLTYFYTGYSAEIYGYNANKKYLDDFIDVFIDLLDSKHMPTDGDYVWLPDVVTGIESEVGKHLFTEEELKLNGGFKVYSRMVPPDNKIYHFANDRPIVIDKRDIDKDAIKLPERLSKMLNETIIRYIIEEHKKADTQFYKELTTGYIDTRYWRERTKTRNYGRNNRMLVKLILQLDSYLHANNKSSSITDRRELIYDLLAIVKMLPMPLKRNRADKASAIRTILKDNPL